MPIISAYSMDHEAAIELDAETRQLPARRWLGRPRTLPVVEYSSTRAPRPAARTIVFLAGGGSSGLMFARVADLCAEHDIRVVLFDLPGHTPDGILGTDTPPRSMIRYANARQRRCLIDQVVRTAIRDSESGRVDIVAHSAGFMDASRIDVELADGIGKFYILGSAIPSWQRMRGVFASAAKTGNSAPCDWGLLLRSHAMSTGRPTQHLGETGSRKAAVRSYQSDEHFSVVLQLFCEKSFGTRIWRDKRVALLHSQGDVIAPPASQRGTQRRLEELGAKVETFQLEGDLPHMFMMFEAGARFVVGVLRGR